MAKGEYNLPMANEYNITNDGKFVSLSGTSVSWTSNHQWASAFKSKARADALAKKVGGVVVPSYGMVPRSSKSSVAPVASKINRSSPYRSI